MIRRATMTLLVFALFAGAANAQAPAAPPAPHLEFAFEEVVMLGQALIPVRHLMAAAT
jgi:hypothetical protein